MATYKRASLTNRILQYALQNNEPDSEKLAKLYSRNGTFESPNPIVIIAGRHLPLIDEWMGRYIGNGGLEAQDLLVGSEVMVPVVGLFADDDDEDEDGYGEGDGGGLRDGVGNGSGNGNGNGGNEREDEWAHGRGDMGDGRRIAGTVEEESRGRRSGTSGRARGRFSGGASDRRPAGRSAHPPAGRSTRPSSHSARTTTGQVSGYPPNPHDPPAGRVSVPSAGALARPPAGFFISPATGRAYGRPVNVSTPSAVRTSGPSTRPPAHGPAIPFAESSTASPPGASTADPMVLSSNSSSSSYVSSSDEESSNPIVDPHNASPMRFSTNSQGVEVLNRRVGDLEDLVQVQRRQIERLERRLAVLENARLQDFYAREEGEDEGY